MLTLRQFIKKHESQTFKKDRSDSMKSCAELVACKDDVSGLKLPIRKKVADAERSHSFMDLFLWEKTIVRALVDNPRFCHFNRYSDFDSMRTIIHLWSMENDGLFVSEMMNSDSFKVVTLNTIDKYRNRKKY